LWFDAEKAGVSIAELFEPLPRERAQEGLIAAIPEALSNNIDQTRESGHNVIFAAIALRALRDHPQYATPSLVEGIRKLIEGFNRAGPGRGYYGTERGWIGGGAVRLPAGDDFPPYRDQQAMASAVVDVGSPCNLRSRGPPLRLPTGFGRYAVMVRAAEKRPIVGCGAHNERQHGGAGLPDSAEENAVRSRASIHRSALNLSRRAGGNNVILHPAGLCFSNKVIAVRGCVNADRQFEPSLPSPP